MDVALPYHSEVKLHGTAGAGISLANSRATHNCPQSSGKASNLGFFSCEAKPSMS